MATVIWKISNTENKLLGNRPQDLVPDKLSFHLELYKVVRSDGQEVSGPLRLVTSGIKF